MKIVTAGASLVLAASLMLGACAKHDDPGNAALANEAVVGETGDPGAGGDNLASPDAPANGADIDPGNSAAGNAL